MLDFVIIGAAQSGLSMAYHLKKLNKSFLILDKDNEIGASWLKRWDSLTLFTPTEFNHMEGLDFPQPEGHYPSKYEVAAYFKLYAATFDLPVQLNTLVTQVERRHGVFHIHSESESWQARNLVVATGPFHTPYTPRFHHKIDDDIYQTHSNTYKNPQQLQEGSTLVVGGGDSGFQIVDEISADSQREVYFSGQTKVSTLPQEFLGKTLWWWFSKFGYLRFSKNTRLGRYLSRRPQPIIGSDVKAILQRPNVTAVGQCLDADGADIVTEHGTLADIKNIVWATGYRPNFDWINGLVLEKDGYPKHQRGVSAMTGLYFIGLPWLHTRGSATLGGVKEDARYLAAKVSAMRGTGGGE